MPQIKIIFLKIYFILNLLFLKTLYNIYDYFFSFNNNVNHWWILQILLNVLFSLYWVHNYYIKRI